MKHEITISDEEAASTPGGHAAILANAMLVLGFAPQFALSDPPTMGELFTAFETPETFLYWNVSRGVSFTNTDPPEQEISGNVVYQFEECPRPEPMDPTKFAQLLSRYLEDNK